MWCERDIGLLDLVGLTCDHSVVVVVILMVVVSGGGSDSGGEWTW